MILILVPILLLLVGRTTSFETDQAKLPKGYSVKVFSQGHQRARGLLRLPNGDVFVVQAASDKTRSAIVLLWDDDNDGIADDKAELVSIEHGLTHGIEYVRPENNKMTSGNTGLLLASSDTTVYAWPYTLGNRKNNLGAGAPLVFNINAQSDADNLGAIRGHWTRTLALSPGSQRYLYVAVGSAGNVDADSYRSRIRRFDLSTVEKDDLDYVFDFRLGEVFADGVRNEVGLAFDKASVLWGVENGADNLYREDLGGDIHNDNPAEELNRFAEPGLHYGYPWCFTEFLLPEGVGLGPGTVWAWPTVTGGNFDEWCRSNTEPSILALPAHSAPLGITFFDHSSIDDIFCSGTFPTSTDGDAFVGYHGSWNRDDPTGYKVVRIHFDSPGGMPTGEVEDLFAYVGSGAKWPSGVRPVDVEFDRCGRLLVSDDGSGSIFTISYDASN